MVHTLVIAGLEHVSHMGKVPDLAPSPVNEFNKRRCNYKRWCNDKSGIIMKRFEVPIQVDLCVYHVIQ